jgi:uncharacterized membrane protein YidH (DUF202 family)
LSKHRKNSSAGKIVWAVIIIVGILILAGAFGVNDDWQWWMRRGTGWDPHHGFEITIITLLIAVFIAEITGVIDIVKNFPWNGFTMV